MWARGSARTGGGSSLRRKPEAIYDLRSTIYDFYLMTEAEQNHLARVRELQRRLDAAQSPAVEENILRLMEAEEKKWEMLKAEG